MVYGLCGSLRAYLGRLGTWLASDHVDGVAVAEQGGRIDRHPIVLGEACQYFGVRSKGAADDHGLQMRLAVVGHHHPLAVALKYWMTNGGCMPGGIERIDVWETAETCAMAPSILAPGWNYTLTTAMPLSDWLSMCSMSSTVVVRNRSNWLETRFSMSSADLPG